MITTELINKEPAILHHRVTGKISPEESGAGAEAAISMVTELIREENTFAVIMDMRGYEFINLEAHRIWSYGFKLHKALVDNVDRVAVVGDDSDRFRAEKEVMDSEQVKFCTELDEAMCWLSA